MMAACFTPVENVTDEDVGALIAVIQRPQSHVLGDVNVTFYRSAALALTLMGPKSVNATPALAAAKAQSDENLDVIPIVKGDAASFITRDNCRVKYNFGLMAEQMRKDTTDQSIFEDGHWMGALACSSYLKDIKDRDVDAIITLLSGTDLRKARQSVYILQSMGPKARRGTHALKVLVDRIEKDGTPIGSTSIDMVVKEIKLALSILRGDAPSYNCHSDDL